jgi:hypothetical protein
MEGQMDCIGSVSPVWASFNQEMIKNFTDFFHWPVSGSVDCPEKGIAGNCKGKYVRCGD